MGRAPLRGVEHGAIAHSVCFMPFLFLLYLFLSASPPPPPRLSGTFSFITIFSFLPTLALGLLVTTAWPHRDAQN